MKTELPPLPSNMASTYLFILGPCGKPDAIFESWITQLGIPPLDQVSLLGEPHISIAEVRKFQQAMQLSPVGGQWRLGMIPKAQNLTREAGNALLKILEDPPSHGLILLAAAHEEQLLSTIVSRCQRLRVKNDTADTAKVNTLDDIKKWRQKSYQERFRLAEEWAKADNLIERLDELTIIGRAAFLAGQLSANDMEKLINFRRIASTTNVSTRLLAENALLALGKE